MWFVVKNNFRDLLYISDLKKIGRFQPFIAHKDP